jgi:hypothetical protein
LRRQADAMFLALVAEADSRDLRIRVGAAKTAGLIRSVHNLDARTSRTVVTLAAALTTRHEPPGFAGGFDLRRGWSHGSTEEVPG